MATNTLKTRIISNHRTAKDWAADTTTVWLNGEILIESDTNKIKIGDGVHVWSELQYATITPEQLDAIKNFSKILVAGQTDNPIIPASNSDTLNLAGSNITITPDATNKKITLSVANASTSTKGVVQLSDTTNSTSITVAGTANAVKKAYDLANTAKTNAATAQSAAEAAQSTADSAQSTANTAKSTADAAMPKKGGTFTGAVFLNADPDKELHAATKQYVDKQISTKIAASDAMVFKGTLGSSGTVTSLPTNGVVKGDTYKIANAGSYAGSNCKVGDMLIALNSGAVEANTTNWAYIPSGNENETYIKLSKTAASTLTDESKSYSGTVVLAEGATRQVDTVISEEGSEKLPTSAAVVSFVKDNAELNQNAISNVKVGNLTISATSKTDTVEFEAGSNVTVTADTTNKKISISAKDTTYTAGTGITIGTGNAINHTNSVTADTVKGDDSKTLGFGNTFKVPSITYDAQGHITATSTTTMTMPATPTSVSGNAGSATKLANTRQIDGMNFNGTANITHFATCSTAAATAAKTVTLSGFNCSAGAKIAVKFTVTNTAANPTLNVSNTGAKSIKYRGAAIAANYLAANRVYEFVYDGTDYLLVGDTDTTYSAGEGIKIENNQVGISSVNVALLTNGEGDKKTTLILDGSV